MKIIYILMLIVLFHSVNAAVNCNEDYDDKEEFQKLSGEVLINYLDDPKGAKLDTLEITQLSAFYEKYKDNWENADCNEIGVSGKNINEIMLKYRGGISSYNFYPFLGIGIILLLVIFIVYRQFMKKEQNF